MYNREQLESYIEQSGLKKAYICEQLELSPAGFGYKLRGEQEFKASEIDKLKDVLHLSKPALHKIFFE